MLLAAVRLADIDEPMTITLGLLAATTGVKRTLKSRRFATSAWPDKTKKYWPAVSAGVSSESTVLLWLIKLPLELYKAHLSWAALAFSMATCSALGVFKS